MTIREFIQKRVWWGMAVMVLAWFCIPIGFHSSFEESIPYLQIVGFLGFGAGIFWMNAIRCPRCKVRLSQIAFQIGVPFLKPRPNYCPYCGVAFDEPLATQSTTNPIHPA